MTIRIAYLAEISSEPEFNAPAVDAGYHDYWARALATGNWKPPAGESDPQIKSTPFFRPPGYPYFLAAVHRLFGPGHLAPRLVQSALGLLNCILAFLLGKRLFGSATGLLFAALMSFYWSFIYFESEFLEPVLLVTLGLLLVALLVSWTENQSPGKALAAGIVLGLFVLVRPNIVPFGFLIPAWSAWVSRRQRLTVGRWGALVLAYASGAILVIFPTAIRNVVVAADWVLISSNGGINLYLGNNGRADGKVANEIRGLGAFRSCFDYPGIVHSLERRMGKPLRHSEASAYFRNEALGYIRDHPLATLSGVLRKTLLFWGPLEVGHNREDEIVREHSRVLKFMPGGWTFACTAFVVGLLAFFGARKTRRDGDPNTARKLRQELEAVALIVLFVAAYFASFLPFFIAGRYRVPLVPFLLLLGSYGFVRIGEAAVRGGYRRAASWLIAGGLLYAVLARNPTGYRPDPAKWHYQRGIAYTARGEREKAVAAYDDALRLSPRFADARLNRGLIFKELGKTDEAARDYVASLRDKPDSAEAHANLGVIFAERGQIDLALAEYRRALDARPDISDVHFNVGILLAEQGNLQGAAEHLAEAVRLNPHDAEANTSLGAVLADLADPGRAARAYRKALEPGPDLDGPR